MHLLAVTSLVLDLTPARNDDRRRPSQVMNFGSN